MLRWGNTGVTEWAVFARYPALVSERNKTRNRASILEFRRTRRFDLLWGAWSLILSLNQRVLGSNPSASTKLLKDLGRSIHPYQRGVEARLITT